MANLSMTTRWLKAGTLASLISLPAIAQPGIESTHSSSLPGSQKAYAPAVAAPAAREEKTGPGAEFLKYWKSGLAELSSYAITAERYGEMRKAQGVLVFVYEEINADTRVKVESDKTPPAKRVPVLKLNSVLKFTTGVYDYSIMTSVFAGLSGPGVQRPLQPQKVSFTSQEWCGNVFHQVIPRPKGLFSEIHSYFEAEGDAVTTLPYPDAGNSNRGVNAPGTFYYEDEMPILVRELDGPFAEAGAPLRMQLVPGLWERRKRHVPLAFTEAVLTKVGPETLAFKGKSRKAVKWTLETMGMTATYHVEAGAPRKLLAWENSRGEKGELIASIRSAYWEHNRNVDAP
ncbi:MAG TPA: hypothetical protein VJ385_16465, partial [Fibrobacteria bacterium]|nr:hypothetical protein [Fibrobacteria bacterium]